MGFELGDPVRVEMRKWGDRPHWEFDARWLGSDEHGDWIGIPSGTEMVRPGASYVARSNQVGLSPRADLPDGERWWLGTFHAPGSDLRVSVYVDIATPPVWDGATLRTVDLDLDVVRGETGRVWVDDEDEFAQHRVELGYPAEITVAAMRSCGRVHEALAAGHAPYDGSHERWQVVLSDLGPDSV
ncbi:MAG: DUF402 domain-containing protein [Nocardioides sp.]|nr:DUF402 domain-containing protein [Nocardioides sp.]